MPRRYSRPHGPWTCQVCTYQNQPRRRNCEMCNKPVGTAAPPTVLAAPSTSTTTASRPPRTYGLHSASGQIVPLSKATVKARVRDFCVEVDIEQVGNRVCPKDRLTVLHFNLTVPPPGFILPRPTATHPPLPSALRTSSQLTPSTLAPPCHAQPHAHASNPHIDVMLPCFARLLSQHLQGCG